jgi:hypothetical protein
MKNQSLKTALLTGMITLMILHAFPQIKNEQYICMNDNSLNVLVVPIVDHYLGNKIALYTNLKNEILTLKVNNLNVMSYHIIDATGKIYKTERLLNKSTQIDISNLPPKTYFITVEKRDGIIVLFKVEKKTNTKNYTFAKLF